MQFTNKGKWIKQISESLQRNEASDEELLKLAKKITNYGSIYIPVKQLTAKLIDKTGASTEQAMKVAKMIFKESSRKNEGLDKKHIDYLNGRLEHVFDLDGVVKEVLGPVRDYMVKYNIKVADYLPYMPDETKRRIAYACRRQNRVPSNKYMKDDIFAGFWHSGKEKALLESAQKNEDDEKVFVRNMSTGNSYYINKSSFDKDKHEIVDDSQQSNTDTSSTSLVFEIHGLLKRQKSLEMEVQRYKKIYDDAIKNNDKQKADKANEMYNQAKKSLDTVKSEIQAKKSSMK